MLNRYRAGAAIFGDGTRNDVDVCWSFLVAVPWDDPTWLHDELTQTQFPALEP